MTSKDFYNVKIINDIIYNENTHIVSVFKDYLILDDISEFLKRRYASFETKPRLTKIYEFYDKYSKVFPNYVVLPESKYMFKNIERKQRMIDEKQKFRSEKDKKLKEKQEKQNNFGGFSDLMDTSQTSEKMFDTKFIDSVMKATPARRFNDSGSMERSRVSQFEEHKIHSSMISNASEVNREQRESSWSKIQAISNQSQQSKPAGEMELHELVEHFIEKDSEILTDISINSSINMEQSIKNSEDRRTEKRKVKRVDYTLKLVSNDIERSNPSNDNTNTSKKPSDYKVNYEQVDTDFNQEASASKFNKCIRRKPGSQQKRVEDREIKV